MSKNTDRLCAALTTRMQRTVKAGLPMGLDLGQITEVLRNGQYVLDLTPDALRKTIPQGSYSTLGSPGLTDGDRVVVAWIGNEPIVLGRLVGT